MSLRVDYLIIAIGLAMIAYPFYVAYGLPMDISIIASVLSGLIVPIFPLLRFKISTEVKDK